MSTEAGVPPTGPLATLTARLDGLRVDQSPDDLSEALRSAITEHVLYETYLSFLVVDKVRTTALLEVFDKVSPGNRAIR